MDARNKPSRRPTNFSDRLPDPLSRPSYDALGLLCCLSRLVLGLPGRFSSSFLRLLGRLSCDVLGLPCGLSRCVLRSLRSLTYRFLGLVRRLSRGLLGLLGYLVDRVFYAVLLGDLVEGVL